MIEELEVYWPEIKKRYKFLKHEWDDHGGCYLMNILRSNSEYYQRWDKGDREEIKMEIARIYFKTALKLTKELNLST